MLNFAWTMADFAPLFPEHIMGHFMLVWLCSSTTVTDLAILSDGAGGQPSDGNMVSFSSTFPSSLSMRENWLIGE